MLTPVFKKISITFKIDKQKYYGIVIASPESLYLVMNQVRNDTALALGAVGGLVGGLIVGAITTMASKKDQPIRTCKVGELDAQILTHPDWPLRGQHKLSDKQVLIIPREAVDVIEHPAYSNFLKFLADQTPIAIEYTLFHGKSVRDYLLNTGWTLKWRGELLQAETKTIPG